MVLLEPGAHLGGMVTGGLSATDIGYFGIIGGYAREFYMKAAAHYGVHDLERAERTGCRSRTWTRRSSSRC